MSDRNFDELWEQYQESSNAVNYWTGEASRLEALALHYRVALERIAGDDGYRDGKGQGDFIALAALREGRLYEAQREVSAC